MVSFEVVKEKVEGLGYKIELKNNGVQFYIKCKKGAVNYYPRRDVWVDDKNKTQTNLNKMLRYLRENSGALRPSQKMPMREYICMRVFGWVFADLYRIGEYGFKTWAELYDYIIDNQVDELKTSKGDKNWLVSDYEGAYLPTLLQEFYTDIEYIVTGIRTFNVKL